MGGWVGGDHHQSSRARVQKGAWVRTAAMCSEKDAAHQGLQATAPGHHGHRVGKGAVARVLQQPAQRVEDRRRRGVRPHLQRSG